jgi:hypothetical protein
MSTLTTLANSILRNEPQRLLSASGLTLLALALTALPGIRAAAYSEVEVPLNIGSVNDYMRQALPRDRGYGYGPHMPYRGAGGQGYYGAPPGCRSQMNASTEEAMVIALLVLQHYEERHERREIRHHRRHSGWARNPMQLPLGYGY